MNQDKKNEEPVVYRGDAITSPINQSNPQSGDPCHTLTDDDRNYVVYDASTRMALEDECQGIDLYNGSVTGEKNMNLTGTSQDPHHVPCVFENHRQDARFKPVGETCVAVSAQWGTGGNNQPMVLEGNGSRSSHHGDGFSESETMHTLNTVEVHAVVDPKTYQETCGTLSGGAHASGFNGQDAHNDMLVSQPVVRRLTPRECEALQGFPDDWTNIGDWRDTKGKKHKASDAPRYRALGNSLALPFWQWLAGRIVAELKKDGVEDPTMASLFDGIGGFPLVFQRNGCRPVWASEIEEFPIAVTKKHFPEEEEEEK